MQIDPLPPAPKLSWDEDGKMLDLTEAKSAISALIDALPKLVSQINEAEEEITKARDGKLT